MGFFSKNTPKTPFSEEALTDCTNQKEAYLLVLLALFQYVKDFCFDLDEIETKAFKNRIDTLTSSFEQETNLKKIGKKFESEKSEIAAFIQWEKDYLSNKEAEFKEIITVLSSGIAMVNSENQRFNATIHEETLKLEKITQLDDIRKIKTELTKKISTVKTFIQEKQAQDAEHIESLSNKVDTLKIALEETTNVALTDGLTGAFNRLAFDTEISKLVTENKRGFSLIMMDVDNFKLINDAYGHQIGDRVLVALVEKSKKLIREGDFLARYGGEEFIIIFPGTSLKDTIKKAEKLCTSLAETEYAVDDRKGSQPLSFTISLGVATRRRSDSVSSLISRADKALYKAKALGKNQVVSEKDID